ncbi:hypothetical protein BGW42_008282 [Actinomortierella wolfii]|nr:hypothetical protein BGW42_008282 [Actinomortierella wolfii]
MGVPTTSWDFTLELSDRSAKDSNLLLPRVAPIDGRNVLFSWNAVRFCYRCGSAEHEKATCQEPADFFLSEAPPVTANILGRAFPPPTTRSASPPACSNTNTQHQEQQQASQNDGYTPVESKRKGNKGRGKGNAKGNTNVKGGGDRSKLSQDKSSSSKTKERLPNEKPASIQQTTTNNTQEALQRTDTSHIATPASHPPSSQKPQEPSEITSKEQEEQYDPNNDPGASYPATSAGKRTLDMVDNANDPILDPPEEEMASQVDSSPEAEDSGEDDTSNQSRTWRARKIPTEVPESQKPDSIDSDGFNEFSSGVDTEARTSYFRLWRRQ